MAEYVAAYAQVEPLLIEYDQKLRECSLVSISCDRVVKLAVLAQLLIVFDQQGFDLSVGGNVLAIVLNS